MKGKLALTSSQIDSVISNTPGAYILVNSNNNTVYIGRSDSDLNNRLKNHLPESETNPCTKRSIVTDFYFENTTDAYNAYLLECDWYHNYRPTCNMAHPAKNSLAWVCPVCKL